MASDLRQGLADLASRVGGARAALVIERSGIEVATWGDADFELVAAELADLWKQAGASEGLVPSGAPRALSLLGGDGDWVAVPVGSDYVLAVLAEPGTPSGKARFYATEWAHERREEFL